MIRRDAGRAVSVAAVLALGVYLLLRGEAALAWWSEPPERVGVCRYLVLTWSGPDTATTMDVRFGLPREVEAGQVRYDTRPRFGWAADYPFVVPSRRTARPGLTTAFHAATLTGLEPGRDYWFIAGAVGAERGAERRFRTLPTAVGPESILRFVCGGDQDATPQAERLLHRAMQQEPRALWLGGDLAYDNGELRHWARTRRWLELWTRCAVTPDGRTVPGIFAVGNHEVGPDGAPLYLDVLAQDPASGSAFTRHLGDRAALLVLDSDHLRPHAQQAAWLDGELGRLSPRPWRLALYHVPLYPSVRPYDDRRSRAGRTHWAPIFDRHGLAAAFEHHDHAHKRTFPLRGGRIDPAGGTVYLGDGGFGVSPMRAVDPRRWYLARSTSRLRHFWVVDIGQETLTCRAVGERGTVIDALGLRR